MQKANGSFFGQVDNKGVVTLENLQATYHESTLAPRPGLDGMESILLVFYFKCKNNTSAGKFRVEYSVDSGNNWYSESILVDGAASSGIITSDVNDREFLVPGSTVTTVANTTYTGKLKLDIFESGPNGVLFRVRGKETNAGGTPSQACVFYSLYGQKVR